MRWPLRRRWVIDTLQVPHVLVAARSPPHVCQALQTLDVDAYVRADTTYNNLLAQLRAQGDPTTRSPRQTWHDLFNNMKRPQAV